MMLAGKKVLIIGGANGIGRATHDQALADGAEHIAVFDLDRRAGTQLTGPGVEFHHVDITDFDALAAELTKAWDAVGGFDVAANCAGLGIPRRIRDTSVAEFQAHLDLNLIPSLVLLRELGPRMQQQGHGAIVTVASVTATQPLYGNVSYAAAKAALIALTQVAALEFAPEVRSNAVAPGTIATRLTAVIDDTPEYRDPILNATPLARFGDPVEVAATIAFLLSDHARYITGQVLTADGGLSISQPGMGPMASAMPDLLAGVYLGAKPPTGE